MTTLTRTASVVPLTSGLGVEVQGIAFEDVAGDEDFVDFVRRLLRHHLVVLMRQQRVEPASLTSFTENFGPLLDIRRHGDMAVHVPGHDLIKVISNAVLPDGRRLGDGNSSAQIWHSDSTPWEAPTGHIAFDRRSTPDPAPTTYFLSMLDAYESLPEATKERIATLRVAHHQYPRQIEVEIARTGPSLPLEERQQGRVHPLVRRHMATSRPVLFLPTRRDSIVVGWGEQESRELLEELWDHVDRCPVRAAVALQPDDFVIWDNVACVHSRDGWPEEQSRVMWHVSAEGEVPTPRFGSRVLNVIGLDDDQRRAVNVASDY